jgi:hypothetical protein
LNQEYGHITYRISSLTKYHPLTDLYGLSEGARSQSQVFNYRKLVVTFVISIIHAEEKEEEVYVIDYTYANFS